MSSNINTNLLDITFPIAGQDNDTQGFRTNWSVIRNNLNTASAEITSLQANVTTVESKINGVITVQGAIQFANLSTIQINSILSASAGMTVYNYNTGNIQVYNGTKWANITLS
jgi:hypothetical protein